MSHDDAAHDDRPVNPRLTFHTARRHPIGSNVVLFNVENASLPALTHAVVVDDTTTETIVETDNNARYARTITFVPEVLNSDIVSRTDELVLTGYVMQARNIWVHSVIHHISAEANRAATPLFRPALEFAHLRQPAYERTELLTTLHSILVTTIQTAHSNADTLQAAPQTSEPTTTIPTALHDEAVAFIQDYLKKEELAIKIGAAGITNVTTMRETLRLHAETPRFFYKYQEWHEQAHTTTDNAAARQTTDAIHTRATAHASAMHPQRDLLTDDPSDDDDDATYTLDPRPNLKDDDDDEYIDAGPPDDDDDDETDTIPLTHEDREIASTATTATEVTTHRQPRTPPRITTPPITTPRTPATTTDFSQRPNPADNTIPSFQGFETLNQPLGVFPTKEHVQQIAQVILASPFGQDPSISKMAEDREVIIAFAVYLLAIVSREMATNTEGKGWWNIHEAHRVEAINGYYGAYGNIRRIAGHQRSTDTENSLVALLITMISTSIGVTDGVFLEYFGEHRDQVQRLVCGHPPVKKPWDKVQASMIEGIFEPGEGPGTHGGFEGRIWDELLEFLPNYNRLSQIRLPSDQMTANTSRILAEDVDERPPRRHTPPLQKRTNYVDVRATNLEPRQQRFTTSVVQQILDKYANKAKARRTTTNTTVPHTNPAPLQRTTTQRATVGTRRPPPPPKNKPVRRGSRTTTTRARTTTMDDPVVLDDSPPTNTNAPTSSEDTQPTSNVRDVTEPPYATPHPGAIQEPTSITTGATAAKKRPAPSTPGDKPDDKLPKFN
jgi:hypothetical protein